MMLSKDFFKKRFDTSLIEPQISDDDFIEFIEKCIPYADFFAGIASNLHQLPILVEHLKGTGIGAAGPVAYPLGNLPTEIKILQIEEAIEAGANQVDVVMKIEALRVDDFDSVWEDAEAVVKCGRGRLKSISLIPNTANLTKGQKIKVAEMVNDLGAVYKTNTGFGLVTTLEDIHIVREAIGDKMEIMVSGGCRTTEKAIEFFNAGVNKIATSTPIDIFEGFNRLLEVNFAK
jgi:deoxyribose-phosphate aldolase